MSYKSAEAKLDALCRLGQALVLLRDEVTIADTVLQIAEEVLDFGDSDFLLVDEARRELYLAARRGELEQGEALRLPLDGPYGVTVAAARGGQVIYVPDVREDPRYVNTGFAALSELAVPVQLEDRVLGIINVESRKENAFTPADIQLLSTLAAQAALALENARFYAELARRHKDLAALYSLAEAVTLPVDLESILEHALERVMEVTQAQGGAIRLIDPQTSELVLAAHKGLSGAYVHEAGSFPITEEIVGWVARTATPSLSDDMWTDPRVSPQVRELLQVEGHRSLAQVPLQAQEKVVGTLGLVARTPGFFTQDDLDLLSAIGQQLGVAIANAQLFEETQRRARRLATLNAVAAVINQPLPLQEIMDQAVAKVLEVMETEAGGIRLLDQATGELVIVSCQGLSPEYVRSVDRLRLGDGVVGRVAQSGEPLVLKNVAQDPGLAMGPIAAEGFQTFAVVPLRTKEKVVGTLAVVTRRQREFGPEEIDLLTAIGHQIGVAVENARLYTSLTQRARELEAVHAVAAAVNRPADLEEILTEGLKQVLAVTGFVMGAIALYNPPDDILVLKNHQGLPPQGVSWLQEHLQRKSGEPWPEGEELLTEQIPLDHPEIPDWMREESIHLWAEVALFAEGDLVGVLSVATREALPFTPEERSMLQGIGHQLGTAIANARLLEETERRARRLAALNAVAAAINQALDLETVLSNAVDRIIEVVRVDAAGIRLIDPQRNRLNVAYSRGFSPEYLKLIQSYAIEDRPARRLVLEGKPILVNDMWSIPWPPGVRAKIEKEGVRSRAEVPLRSRDRIVGSLGVASRRVGTFGPADVDLLIAIGHQLGVAIENAQLRQQALEAERQAAVGRVAGTVAHELRSPLGGIIRSAEFLARPELSGATRQKLSQAIVAMARRLLNTAQEILDYTRGDRSSLELAPCALPELLEQVIEVLRVDLSEQGIEVVTEWGYTGEVQVDAGRIAQVVYNIAANARDAMPEGGRLTVSTRQEGPWVELRFSDTGHGVPPDLAERIFEPFFSHGKREGAGLGLSISRRIVREHGGDLTLESPGAVGATFIVRLPREG